jgi:hypothetical protein
MSIERQTYGANKKLCVVNMLGGPSTYKSATAAKLYSYMCERTTNRVELVPEFAKDLVWDNRTEIFGEQDYIFAHQNQRLRRLVHHNMDVAITDSSLLLSLVYRLDDFPSTFDRFVLDAYHTYNNVSVLFKRDMNSPYHPEGRNETHEEAMSKDAAIEGMLTKHDIPHLTLDSCDPHKIAKVYQYIASLCHVSER